MNSIDAKLAQRILSAFTDPDSDNITQYIYSSPERFYSTDGLTVISINKSLVTNHSELTGHTIVDSSITDRFKKSFDYPLDISISLLDNDIIGQLRYYAESLSGEHQRDKTITLLYDDLFMSTIEFYAQSTGNPRIISMATDDVSVSNSKDDTVTMLKINVSQLLKILNLFANSDSLTISFSDNSNRIKFTGSNVQAVALLQ